MRRFGLDYQSLAAINPRLIYMSVNGFGNRGPEHNQPGFDPLLQARSGLMAAQGGHHHPPLYLTCAICDYGAAMLSAFGCVLALRARERLGRGQLCETSLLAVRDGVPGGRVHFLRRPPRHGKRPPRIAWPLGALPRLPVPRWRVAVRPRRGTGAVGCDARACASSPPSRPMRWPPASRRMAHSRGQSPRPSRASTVRRRWRRLARPAYLRSARIARLISSTIRRSRPTICSPNCAIRNGATVVQTGTLAKFSATPGKVEHAAPLLGEHTDEILARYLGYGRERIEDLRRRGIVR